MKKFVALLLAVLMVASLCACGQKDTQTGSDIKTVTAGKLTMSTNAQFPPYESVADDGKGYEGTGFEGIAMKDVAVLHMENGRPYYELRGLARERAEGLGAVRLHLSLSHEQGMAGAFCVLEGE